MLKLRGMCVGGSNPLISSNGSYICTKLCVIQVLVRKRKTNYGDSYHKELEETDRILLARGPDFAEIAQLVVACDSYSQGR